MTDLTEQTARELIAAIAALRADLKRPDRVDVPKLLATIDLVAPGHEFTTGELVSHARYADPLRDILAGTPRRS